MTVRLFPAVLPGGSATRLCPLSTDNLPKQFHALGSDRTMLQETARRFSGAADDITVLPPIVICSAHHRAQVADQLLQVGVLPSSSCWSRSAATARLQRASPCASPEAADPQALVILMAADHRIADSAGFSQAVVRAVGAAEDHIVTFGVTPPAPETRYGYIEGGEMIDAPVRKVLAG